MELQVKELETVKRRIRALLAKTGENGATEAEAHLALTKVGELLEQYNLNMDEISLRQEICVNERFVLRGKTRNAAFSCLMALGKLCQLTVWHNRRYDRQITLHMFGLEQDVALAKFLLGMIESAEVAAAVTFRKSDTYKNFHAHRKIATSNFRQGFASRLSTRILDIHRENREREERAAEFHAAQMAGNMLGQSDAARMAQAEQTTGTALISLAKDKYVDEEFKKLGIKLHTVTTYNRSRNDYNSRQAGVNAANTVNLTRPIANSGAGSSVLMLS